MIAHFLCDLSVSASLEGGRVKAPPYGPVRPMPPLVSADRGVRLAATLTR